MSIVKAGQKSVKERSNGHDRFILGYLLVYKDSPKKIFSSLSFTQKSKRKIKAIFRINLIFVPPSRL